MDQASSLKIRQSSLSQHQDRAIRAGMFLAQALMYKQQGDLKSAKEKIKECTAVANGSLSHNQLTSTSLNVLGSIFLSENLLTVDGVPTATLLKSALVLAYRSEDFYPKFHSLSLLSVAYTEDKDHINESYNLSYKVGMEKDYLYDSDDDE